MLPSGALKQTPRRMPCAALVCSPAGAVEPCRLSRQFRASRRRLARLLSQRAQGLRPRPSRAAATRISTIGARACSIIGGTCSCSRRAGHRSCRPASSSPATCRRSLATTTTSRCFASSSPPRPWCSRARKIRPPFSSAAGTGIRRYGEKPRAAARDCLSSGRGRSWSASRPIGSDSSADIAIKTPLEARNDNVVAFGEAGAAEPRQGVGLDPARLAPSLKHQHGP